MTLSRAERSDTEAFLGEMLSIYPLLGVRAFEQPKVVAAPRGDVRTSGTQAQTLDTLIVPARENGFKEVFLGSDCWYAVRIAAGKLDQIKYIAAYQSAPVSAITHFAPVDTIESYGDSGKYKFIFAAPATELERPIVLGDAPSGLMQGPRYTNLEKLKASPSVASLF